MEKRQKSWLAFERSYSISHYRGANVNLITLKARKCLIQFGPVEFNVTLLMASDGLFKYTSPDKIKHTVHMHNIDECGAALIDSV